MDLIDKLVKCCSERRSCDGCGYRRKECCKTYSSRAGISPERWDEEDKESYRKYLALKKFGLRK